MACGLTGAGKSTLLNGICGRKAFVVGDQEPGTDSVQKHPIERENCKLVLYDTPGFEDESGNEDQYLAEIKGKCENVDTLFYCISVNGVRIKLSEDKVTLNKLKEALDIGIWNNCVIVLTFANTIVDKIEARGINTEGEIKEEFDKRITMWERKIKEAFSLVGIDPAAIPFVYAGITKTPYLLKSDSKPWLSTFWKTVRYKSHPDGQAVLMCINIERIALKYKVKKNSNLPLHQQQLLLEENTLLDMLKRKFPIIATTLITGSTSGIAGASTGALFGALAIGLPTFGAAAGVGLVLGGLIGGGIGVVIGATTGKIIEKVQDSSRNRNPFH